MMQKVVMEGVAGGGERGLCGALAQLKIAALIVVAQFATPFPWVVITEPDATGNVALNLSRRRSARSGYLRGGVKTAPPAAAEFPLLCPRRNRGQGRAHYEHSSQFHIV